MRPLNNSSAWPTLAVYDIESYNWIDVQLICHVDEMGNRESFSTISDYMDWLFADFEGTHVWAHAGGRFDHRFLMPEAQKRGWDFRVAITGGSIVLLIIKNNDRELHFADSFRLMPNALKSIGKTVNLPKLDVNRQHMEKLTVDEMKKYCFRDCDIALRGLELMREKLSSVNADFALTLASIASRWVRRGNTIDWTRIIKKNKKTELLKADEFCEPAYFGGRTEMFRRGTFKGPIYYYDIVSSYPTSMQFELPLYFKDYVKPPSNITNESLRSYLSHPGVTECWVNIPRTRVAPLCVKFEGRLTFPYGHKLGRQEAVPFPSSCPCGAPLRSHKCRVCKTVFPKHKWSPGRWTNIELLAALDRGAKILPIIQARFVGVNFLASFVKTFYDLRQKAKDSGDVFGSYAFKICLNSLYGKLVESTERTGYATAKEEIDKARNNKRVQVKMSPTPGVYSLVSETEGPFRHVAAGAYVTAYSRLSLLKGLETALKLGGDIYYCDTDSIMTNVPLHELEGKNLGQWQLEHVFDEVELVLPKVYRAVDSKTKEVIYKCKGVPMVRENDHPSIPALRWEAFKQYADTHDPEMARLLGKEGLTGFIADIQAGVLSPRVTTLLRCLQGSDRKRDWSGHDSWPLQIGAK